MTERTIGSLDKALTLLDALRVAGQPVGLKALSQRTGINPATAHLLLRTLVVHNYVEQDPLRREYTLGVAIIDAGQRARQRVTLATVVEPFARHVHRVSAESVFVRVLRAGQIYSLLEFESPQAVAVRPHRVPFSELRAGYAFASGKVFLANMDPKTRARVLGRPPYEPVTEHTLTDPKDIARELDAVCLRGFATDREEFMIGLCCVAVPLRDASGQVTAIMSTALPSARATDERLSELAGLLVQASVAATAQLQRAGVGGAAVEPRPSDVAPLPFARDKPANSRRRGARA